MFSVKPILYSFFLLLLGCGDCANELIVRLPSPDKYVDALVTKKDCGATADYSYRIFIVPHDATIPSKDYVFLSDKTEGIEVEWEDSKQLTITYLKARIFHFRNFWMDDRNYIVMIKEREK